LELALAVEALAGYLERADHPLDARHFALGAAGEATSVLKECSDLETSVLVGQIRSTAIDLLQAAGMDPSEALEALREASRLGSGERLVSGSHEPHTDELINLPRPRTPAPASSPEPLQSV
jgi:alkylhydroperoxidase family enzyme